jgi:hypothetical protein
MACEEMDLYYRYLDAVEEAKRRAQPWQCEVTVFPQDDDAKPDARPAAKPAAGPAPSPFKCDETE